MNISNVDKFVLLRYKAFLFLQFFAVDRATELPFDSLILFCHSVG